MDLAGKYNKGFQAAFKGRVGPLLDNQLEGSSRLRYIFDDILRRYLDKIDVENFL